MKCRTFGAGNIIPFTSTVRPASMVPANGRSSRENAMSRLMIIAGLLIGAMLVCGCESDDDDDENEVHVRFRSPSINAEARVEE